MLGAHRENQGKCKQKLHSRVVAGFSWVNNPKAGLALDSEATLIRAGNWASDLFG